MLKDKSSAEYQDMIAADSDIWFVENACETSVLTSKEERECLLRIKEGDAVALQTFVEANIRLVYSICNDFQGRGVDLGDLLQECIVHMVEKIIPNFKSEKGFRFSTYAKISLSRYCLLVVAHQKRPIKLTPEIEARVQFLSEILDDKTFSSKDIGWRIEYVARVERVGVNKIIALLPFIRCFDTMMRVLDEEGTTLSDRFWDTAQPSVQYQVEQIWLEERVIEALETQLTPDQKIVVELRFGLDGGPGLEYKEIGQICGGITKEAVRQRLVKAYAKLRSYFEYLPGLQAYFSNLEIQAE